MSDQIKNSALFKNVLASRSSHNNRRLHLCSACHTHLKKDVTPEAGGNNEDGDGEQIMEGISDGDGIVEDRAQPPKKKDSDPNSFRYIVYAFLWDVLSGKHSDHFDSYYFHEIYGEKLWQMIPVSMRPWWIDSAKEIHCMGIVRLRIVQLIILLVFSLTRPKFVRCSSRKSVSHCLQWPKLWTTTM